MEHYANKPNETYDFILGAKKSKARRVRIRPEYLKGIVDYCKETKGLYIWG